MGDGAVNESAQQVGFADRILLNKVDASTERDVAAVEAEIRTINQSCPIFRISLVTAPDKVPLDQLLKADSFSLDRVLLEPDEPSGPSFKRQRTNINTSLQIMSSTYRPQSRHDSNVSTFVVVLESQPLILDRFMQVINSLRAEYAVDLYRYKGLVCVKEPSGAVKRAVLQGVHDLCQFEPRGLWPASQPIRSEIVFIGRNLDRDLWNRLFEKTKEGILDPKVKSILGVPDPKAAAPTPVPKPAVPKPAPQPAQPPPPPPQVDLNAQEVETKLDQWVEAKRSRHYKKADELWEWLRDQGVDPTTARPRGMPIRR